MKKARKLLLGVFVREFIRWKRKRNKLDESHETNVVELEDGMTRWDEEC